MKKILLTFLFFVFGSIHPVFGGINNSGTFVFDNSTCWGDIVNKETGIVEGKNSTFLAIVNYGTVNLDKCTMKEEIKSFGQLNAIQTTFQKNVTICDGEAILNNCKLENLFVKEDFEERESLPHIILSNATKISGSIVFTTGQGKVFKTPDVVISGQVINGSIMDLDPLD